MTVVDASIVVRLLLNRPDDAPLRGRFANERRLAAPALIDAEVASAVRGLLLGSAPAARLGQQRGDELLADYGDLPIDHYPMLPLQHRVLELRDNFTAYDAFYVTLAETLDEPLLTDDAKFERAPAVHGAVVETWD